MSQLQKSLMISIVILLTILITFDISLFNAIAFAPDKLNVNYRTISDRNIPYVMDDVSIVYFTDLQYGEFQNKTRTDRVFERIRHLNPDILIFGGDLFDTSTKIDAKTKKYVVRCLSSIKAPLGKFAVWGEKDIQDPSRKKIISSIYKKSQIEVINNSNVSLSNQSTAHIKLIGLASEKGIKKATENISGQSYNLLVTHKPDSLMSNQLADVGISLALAGHAHGTQVTYPILGAFKTYDGARRLNRDKSQNLEFDYMISSGIGCTYKNVRLNADPEIDYLILNHK